MTAQPLLFDRPGRVIPDRIAPPPSQDTRRDVLVLATPPGEGVKYLRHYAVTPLASVRATIERLAEVPRALRAASDGSSDPLLVDAEARTRAIFGGVTIDELRDALDQLKREG